MSEKTKAQLKKEVLDLTTRLEKVETERALFKHELKRITRQIKKQGLTKLVDVGEN